MKKIDNATKSVLVELWEEVEIPFFSILLSSISACSGYFIGGKIFGFGWTGMFAIGIASLAIFLFLLIVIMTRMTNFEKSHPLRQENFQ